MCNLWFQTCQLFSYNNNIESSIIILGVIMLEDSITCSPSKSSKSITEARLKRKTRKKGNLSQQIKIDQEIAVGVHNVINEFYKDSDDGSPVIETKNTNLTFMVTKPSAIIRNFKPFELEKSLAMADHVLPQEFKQNKPQKFPVNQGFISCSESLTQFDLKNVTCETNKDSSFIITESELITCCRQAEKVLEYDISKEQNVLELTPEKNQSMKLVNSILEDFSQSPLAQEQMVINSFWQYTPEFRLRKQPVKYYSRKFLNSRKTNLNQRFEEENKTVLPEYDTDRSSCSSLSIQENDSEILNNQLIVTSTNNTSLCENLLNLSRYFSQNSTNQNVSDEQLQDTSDLCSLNNEHDNLSIFHNITDLIKDILTLRSTHHNKTRYNSYNSIDEFHGFSDEDNKSDKIGDIRPLNMPINEEDNIRVDDWNEDDCHDIFACINTENVLQLHNIKKPNNEREDIVECTTESKNERCIAPSFKTASFKPIKVSREAHLMAAKILSAQLNNCDNEAISKEENIFENPEDYEWNDDCDLFLNFQTPIPLKESPESKPTQKDMANELPTISQQENDVASSSKVTPRGFKTASGKDVNVSKKAQYTVQKLLNEFTSDVKSDYNYEEELNQLKCNIYSKTHNLEKENSSIKDIKQRNTGVEFQTAKGKKIVISMAARQNVQKLLNEFCVDSKQNYEEDLNSMKQEIYNKNNKIKQINTDISEEAQEPGYIKLQRKTLDNKEFLIANGKIFNNKTNKELLLNLKSIKNDIIKSNDKYKDGEEHTHTLTCCISNQNSDHFSVSSEIPVKELTKAGTKEEIMLSKICNEIGNGNNKGFQNANGNNIAISANARKTVENLMQEFNTGLDAKQYENELKEIKTKIEIKNKELKGKPIQDSHECANMTLSQCNSNTEVGNKQNLTPKYTNCKRTKSMDYCTLDSPYKTPPVKNFKCDCAEKSPSFSAAQSVILRKNLLSLTKRRKSKTKLLTNPAEGLPIINKELYGLNVITASPIQSCVSTKVSEQTPLTPNLKEFFTNAPLTSTPRMNKSPKSAQTVEDLDLKPITWRNNDSVSNKSASNSINTSKLSDDLALNITIKSLNPTIKERIDRLKMYGQAPAVSPIHVETHHNCRPSGLRRTRSMFKKK